MQEEGEGGTHKRTGLLLTVNLDDQVEFWLNRAHQSKLVCAQILQLHHAADQILQQYFEGRHQNHLVFVANGELRESQILLGSKEKISVGGGRENIDKTVISLCCPLWELQDCFFIKSSAIEYIGLEHKIQVHLEVKALFVPPQWRHQLYSFS